MRRKSMSRIEVAVTQVALPRITVPGLLSRRVGPIRAAGPGELFERDDAVGIFLAYDPMDRLPVELWCAMA